ncbi:hypothetical protein JTE90_000250 [Oedothorax gibbosus]|uniref:Uncharacterized protein n=1 Tax=Oedothorax gibbosus TaxID=931172 RepID=A0AAV6VRW7_9ARAC|nr:hypothetical protein JTE90_000250 [Oedothorax gibbosus]
MPMTASLLASPLLFLIPEDESSFRERERTEESITNHLLFIFGDVVFGQVCRPAFSLMHRGWTLGMLLDIVGWMK